MRDDIQQINNRRYLLSIVLVTNIVILGYSIFNWLDSKYGYLKSLGVYYPVKQIIILQYVCVVSTLSIVLSLLLMHILRKYCTKHLKLAHVFTFIIIVLMIHFLNIPTSNDQLIQEPDILRRDSLVGWTYLPNTSKKSLAKNSMSERNISIDKNGLRAQTNKKNSQILFLGNSVTFAQQVDDDSTFCALIGGMNGGVDGYSTHQEKDYLINNLADIGYELLIIVVTPVDILTKAESKRKIESTLEGSKIGNNDYLVFLKAAIRSEIERSYIYNLLNIQLPDNESWKDNYYLNLTTKNYSLETWSDWTKSLLDIVTYSEARGAKTLVILSPARAAVESYLQSNNMYLLNKKIAEISSINNLDFLDLLPELSKYDVKEIFYDYIHFNEYGHRVIARSIKDYLNILRVISLQDNVHPPK